MVFVAVAIAATAVTGAPTTDSVVHPAAAATAAASPRGDRAD